MGKQTGTNLTKADVEAAAPGRTTRRVFDSKTRGLALQVTPAGVKTWVVVFRFNNQKTAVTLGRWPAMTVEVARKAAHAAWAKIDAGENPNQAKRDAKAAAVEARKAAVKVKDLVERYKEEHSPTNSKGWQEESARLMKRHILPELGEVPIQDVGPAEISTLLHKMRATPTQANRTRAVLRTMFARAEEWGLRPLGSNPVAVVKKRHTETKRDRRLSDLELKALGETLRTSKEDPIQLLGLRLALLAGMRKGEIQAIRWEWVDLQAGEIRIPPEHHKTGRKTKKARVVHLCSPLVADLKPVVKTIGCPFVFPGRSKKLKDGTIEWSAFTAIQKTWERVREAAKLADKKTPKEEDPGLHDLRRTFGSVAADLGLKGFVGELLGHAEASVTDIYTRAAAEPLKEAAEKIGARIAGILSGKIDPEQEAKNRAAEKAAKQAR